MRVAVIFSILVLGLFGLLFSGASGQSVQTLFEVIWDPVNFTSSCKADPFAHSNASYCMNQTIFLFDTVVWLSPNQSFAFVEATDSTFKNMVENFNLSALPTFFQGTTLGTPYQFVNSGTFYFVNPQNRSYVGTITVLDQAYPGYYQPTSTYTNNINTYNNVLGYFVLVLLAASVAGALLTLFTFLIFPKIKTYPIKLIMYLCVVIIVGNLWFILAFEPTFQDNNALCFITGMIVHGFWVSNFCWTFCIAFNFYQMIVRRNRESESLEKWYHLFAWGFPALCVLCTTSVLDYGDTGGACYITSTLYIFLFFFIPGLTIISLNAILFFFVIREIHETLASAPKTDRKDKKKEIRVYISIFVSIGLSWIFGFLMVLFPQQIIQLIFLTLFSLTTPAQGIFIFIFYCINFKVIGKYAGLVGYVIPYFKRWENLESRGSTSSGRTSSSGHSSRSSRPYRASRSMASASADTADLDTSSRASRSVDDDEPPEEEDFNAGDEDDAGGINFGDDDL